MTDVYKAAWRQCLFKEWTGQQLKLDGGRFTASKTGGYVLGAYVVELFATGCCECQDFR